MSDRSLTPHLPVERRVHHPVSVRNAIEEGRLASAEVRETIAALAMDEEYEVLWEIADSMAKEVSVLVDAERKVWVDIGTRSEVRLAPASGSVIPFRLWLHTHTHDAYASQTDRATLASCSMILQEAIVLGHDHMVRLRRMRTGEGPSLEPEGPLSTWTSDEEVVLYSDIRGSSSDR